MYRGDIIIVLTHVGHFLLHIFALQFIVRVAQWIAYQTSDLGVAGSSPVANISHFFATHWSGRLAQSVERTSNKRTVGGSSPPVTNISSLTIPIRPVV